MDFVYVYITIWHWHSTFQSNTTKPFILYIYKWFRIGTHFKIAIELKAIDVSVCVRSDESPFQRHVKANKRFRWTFIIVIIYRCVMSCVYLAVAVVTWCIKINKFPDPEGCSPFQLWDSTAIKPNKSLYYRQQKAIYHTIRHQIAFISNTTVTFHHNRTVMFSSQTNSVYLFVLISSLSDWLRIYNLQLTCKNIRHNFKWSHSIAFMMNKIDEKPKKTFSDIPKTDCNN